MRDGTTFGLLYDRYADEVFRYARWLCGDTDEAKDITSETFTRAFTGTTELRMESVRAYFLAIARNLHLQHGRSRKRRAPVTDEIPDQKPLPDRVANGRIELERVAAHLQELGEIDRTVFVLGVLERVPYSDIAEMTGLSEGAIKVKIYRIRRGILARFST